MGKINPSLRTPLNQRPQLIRPGCAGRPPAGIATGLQPGQLILPAGIGCVKRRQLALGPREKIDQPTAGQVVGDIQSRFAGDAAALHRPALMDDPAAIEAAAQAQVLEPALGADVHPLAVQDRRHAGAACELAGLVGRGVIRSTARQHFGRINAANLLWAHQLLESGQSIGKIVLEGFCNTIHFHEETRMS